MTNPDISVVVAIHREKKYLQRTLLSISEAAEFAAEHGLAVECVLVFDRSDQATRRIADLCPPHGFVKTTIVEVDNGCVSQTRNAGCRAAAGNYIYIMDADDLISYNSLYLMWKQIGISGNKFILTHQFMFEFGSRYGCTEFFDSDSIPVSAIVCENLYTARIFADRSVFKEVGYVSASHALGYAYEDWHYNCELLARGYRFKVVSDTAFYYRIRKSGRNFEANHETTCQIPPSSLFHPRVFLSFHRGQGRRPGQPEPQSLSSAVLKHPLFQDLMRRANAIDPGVFSGCYEWQCDGFFTNFKRSAAAEAYYAICRLLSTEPLTDVVLLPDDPDRMPDRIAAMIAALSKSRRHVVFCSFSTEPVAAMLACRLKCGVGVDFKHLFPTLSWDEVGTLFIKIMQCATQESSLHLLPGSFPHRLFDRFRRILHHVRVIYYGSSRFFDAAGEATADCDPSIFDFLSSHGGYIDAIVPDSRAAGLWDQRRLGVPLEREHKPSPSAIAPLSI